ncbi:MAG TPA: hypothetical protein VFS39_09565 [Nitrospira sp.]|nr:hypothetical protein [Nitrospira sp.]
MPPWQKHFFRSLVISSKKTGILPTMDHQRDCRVAQPAPSIGARKRVVNGSIAVRLLGLTLFLMSGCVMQSTYDAAVMDLNAAQAELASAKAHKQALSEEVAALEKATQDATRTAEEAVAALRQAKEAAEAEKKAADDRIAKLKHTVMQLTAVQQSMLKAMDAAKQDARALKAAADMYQGRLEQADGPRMSSFASAGSGDPAPQSPPDAQSPSPSLITPPAASAVAPTSASESAPAKTAAPSPMNAPSAATDDSWLSSIIGWLLSLWQAIFS